MHKCEYMRKATTILTLWTNLNNFTSVNLIARHNRN